MSEVTLYLNEEGDVLDGQRNVLPLRITGFHIRGPSEADETALKLVELRGRQMFCGEEPLGELLSVDLDVTGEPDESGSVPVQFPL
jgi:hypothetical protein